jgi:hypothetical protein
MRSLAYPLAASAAAATLVASIACAAAPPPAAACAAAAPSPAAIVPRPTPSSAPVPAVAATPAPVPVLAPAPAATPAPILALQTPAPAATMAAAAAPTPESAALSPPPPASMHVVLADELPYRATHISETTAKAHSHHGKKKHGRHGRPYHPAPGIVVDVSDAQGGLTATDLQRTARNIGYWPFRRCYEEGLRRNQQLAGHVALDLSMATAGAVAHATPAAAGSTLRDESVALCVAREAAHLPLAMPADSPTTAKLDVSLATGDEPVPMQRPVVHADELREALRTSWPAAQQCYATGVAGRPDEGGRLELKFRVKSTGEIAEVAEGDTRFPDVDVTRCVLGVYRAAKLPAIGHGSHETTFVYALHFEAKADAR